jgi:hypothetical protein
MFVLFSFLFLGSGGKYPSIKKLEHGLEDQIYHILRKSRVITNIRYEDLGWYNTEIWFKSNILTEGWVSFCVAFVVDWFVLDVAVWWSPLTLQAKQG